MKVPLTGPTTIPGSARAAVEVPAEVPLVDRTGHWILQFEEAPGSAARAALEVRGAVILQEVPTTRSWC